VELRDLKKFMVCGVNINLKVLDMKKSFLALASLAAIAVGCQVETMTEPAYVEKAVVYEAETESYTPATKTAMSGLDVVWSEGDNVAIFRGDVLAV
jgi:hypothetical protein